MVLEWMREARVTFVAQAAASGAKALVPAKRRVAPIANYQFVHF